MTSAGNPNPPEESNPQEPNHNPDAMHAEKGFVSRFLSKIGVSKNHYINNDPKNSQGQDN